jgi:hypothetical protein
MSLAFIDKLLTYTPIGERKPKITRGESLKGVPVINEGIETMEGPKGERVVLIPRRPLYGAFLRRFLPDEVEPARVILDDLGNKVWTMIDGKRTVSQIISRFAKELGIHRREAETSVVAFLSMLMKRRMVSVVIR